MNVLDRYDWIGLGLWLALWVGYALWAAGAQNRVPSLLGALVNYRRVWMREAYRRENRITDVALIGSLAQSATFFSSTTLLILGGLFALLGAPSDGAEVLGSLPFAARMSRDLLEVKAIVLTLVFVHAFLRFTWSLRQYNLANIMVGAYPAKTENHVDEDRLIRRASTLNELAGANFTQGLRSYYFAIPLLLWLINPWLLLAGSVLITLATWYMEFRSATVRALAHDDGG